MSEDIERITCTDADRAIDKVMYHHFPGTTVTVCVIQLKNGWTVQGFSACIDPKGFDAKAGEQYAYDDAYEKIARFLAYEVVASRAVK